MKTFHKPVLPRAARLNVNRLDLIRLEPPLHDLGNELRPIITAQILRRPVLLDRLLQPVQHVRRLQGSIGPQHVTLPRVFIQDRQQL